MFRTNASAECAMRHGLGNASERGVGPPRLAGRSARTRRVRSRDPGGTVRDEIVHVDGLRIDREQFFV